MSFGENLINLRRQKGWSQDDLANNLNISRQAISKWENNTSKPDVDNIEKISKIFSVKIDELLNNELPNDKAVALDVKKEEKKEKTITIVKLMIIAVIILYAISVIYKFASLLVIVNGVQKYANLNNYHYVITTYDENGLAEKEECWFKDGVSKTVSNIYSDDYSENRVTYIDYNNNSGYMENLENNDKVDIDVDNYLKLHAGYENGAQMFSLIPVEIRNKDVFSLFLEVAKIKNFEIRTYEKNILIRVGEKFIQLDRLTLLPIYAYDVKKNNNLTYDIQVNNVNSL